MTKFNDDVVDVTLLAADGSQLKNDDIFSTDEYVFIDEIPLHVKNSFVSLEDKRFFEHNGIDFYRIAGAVVDNLKSGRFKEGASTITQQLIKNTHLTNEKTITRKFAEARLAIELENTLSKEKILELYLNSIYFGNNCYGIVSAANFYFDKDVQDLSIAESATLAGMISAPNTNSPDKNMDKCIERRNLALTALLNNQKISKEEYDFALQEKINESKIGIKEENNKSYADMVLTQAATILGFTQTQIKHSGLKIYTYFDNQKQKSIINALQSKNIKTRSGKNAQKMAISINNLTGGVEAFFSNVNGNPYYITRQIGSTAKPIVSLAPAFEQNLITPSTMILDEETNFGGYTPSNSGDKYDGWITVRNAFAKSKNIPAIKLLNSINKSLLHKNLENMKLITKNEDVTLNMALGGFENGLTIKQLADSYMMFANDGQFVVSSFIDKIEDNDGNILYKNNAEKTKIYRNDTVFLTTDVLRDVVKYGTAKSLDLNIDIAGKTGTVGKRGSKNNSDALFCSYTKTDTTVFWTFSDYDDLLTSGINGSTAPVEMAKKYYQQIYKMNKPTSFVKPDSVVLMKIDKQMLSQGQIAVANRYLPKEQIVEEYFSIYNMPTKISQRTIKQEKTEWPKKFEEKTDIDKQELYDKFFDKIKNIPFGMF